MTSKQNLFAVAQDCLLETDLDKKIEKSFAFAGLFEGGELIVENHSPVLETHQLGRLKKPILVPPKNLPKRSLVSTEGMAAMLHAIAHIEFNAINIAWDAVYRFRDMPLQYYADWIRVAKEETQHFCLLRQHLRDHGYDYGDFNAHNGLWQAVEKTAHDVLVRMALVPRVYEARGLDVTPDIIEKFQQKGETGVCKTLNIIYQDEIGHVAIGNHWFQYLCQQRKLDPVKTFLALVEEYAMLAQHNNQLNWNARLSAGFTKKELELLQANS